MGERTSSLQMALETVDGLTLEEQEMLLEIVYRRYVEQRRTGLSREIAAAREAYRRGEVRRGTAEDLMCGFSSSSSRIQSPVKRRFCY